MGLYEKLFFNTVNWGKEKGLQDIAGKIHNVIEKKRFIFLDENKVRYIEKDGTEYELTFDDVVNMFIEIGKWESQMKDLGLSVQDIKDILVKEYEAVK